MSSDSGKRKIPWGVSPSNLDCIIQVRVVGKVLFRVLILGVIFLFCFTPPTTISHFWDCLPVTGFFPPYRSLKSSVRVWRASAVIFLTAPMAPLSVRRMVETAPRRAPLKTQDPFSSWISLYRIYRSKINPSSVTVISFDDSFVWSRQEIRKNEDFYAFSKFFSAGSKIMLRPRRYRSVTKWPP